MTSDELNPDKKRDAGYVDKTPGSLPPVERVSGGFKSGDNPAATFNKRRSGYRRDLKVRRCGT